MVHVLLSPRAAGAISTATNSDGLITALRHALAGGTWIEPVLVRPLMTSLARPTEPLVLNSINPRDNHILHGVRRGLVNKEIANQLGLTEPALKAGIQRLFRRFRSANRAQLVAATHSRGAAFDGPADGS